LTVAVPEHFDLYVIGGGALLALLLVVVGILQLAARARALRKRIEGYGDLPLQKTLELTQARLGIASRSVDAVPTLIARAKQALAEINDARTRLAEAASTTREFVRSVVSGR
jgi:ABC-type transporter Mla subunit MlaD